jgi:apolipoprotein N-acyltransferase
MKRLLAALATWTLIFLASPGILSENGWGLIAFVALVPWSLACSRPGRRAFWLEWLAAAIGISALCIWSTYVLWITLLAVAIVPAFYMAVAGVVLRVLARRWPLALAAPAAWCALETLRFLIEPPFGFGWMHLGTHLHATTWIAGSARVFGVGGLSWVLAACAGGIADWIRRRSPPRAGEVRAPSPSDRALPSALLGAGPLLAAIVLGALTHAPVVRAGPRLMLVQPSFAQKRKMESPDARDLYTESLHLTELGLESAKKAGEPIPDLVAWGETMFPVSLVETGLLEAYDRGARSVPWAKHEITRSDIQWMVRIEQDWIVRAFFGRGQKPGAGVLPAGTSFLTGVEYEALRDGEIRRHNAILLWDADGRRADVGGKVHLVPGGEQLCGLERLAWVRDLSLSLAGYVPDLVPFDRTRVFTLKTRNGESTRFGVTVCFDNAYEDPYTEPLRREALDFHLVCSNEAWYEESFEYDQMVAFARLLAIATGRSIVRATNAGITLVIGPDGEDVARLSVDGKDRMVPGTLRVTVPVPAAGESAPTPFFVRAEHGWQALWIGLPVLLALLARISERRAVTGVG